MFVVLSFDFGGGSNVRLHACTDDETRARTTYLAVKSKWDEYNRRFAQTGMQCLVQMIRVPDAYADIEGFDVFGFSSGRPGLPPPTPPCSIVMSNNGEY